MKGPDAIEKTGGSKPILGMVAKRLSLFLFGMSLVTLFYWTTGNFRRFLDSTQSMLLSCLRWLSLGLLMSASLGLAARLLLGPAGKGRGRATLGYAALLAFAAVLLVLAETLAVLSTGLPR
jgi:hypothetical protein